MWRVRKVLNSSMIMELKPRDWSPVLSLCPMSSSIRSVLEPSPQFVPHVLFNQVCTGAQSSVRAPCPLQSGQYWSPVLSLCPMSSSIRSVLEPSPQFVPHVLFNQVCTGAQSSVCAPCPLQSGLYWSPVLSSLLEYEIKNIL